MNGDEICNKKPLCQDTQWERWKTYLEQRVVPLERDWELESRCTVVFGLSHLGLW
jgi:hypothetical protein